MFRAMLLYGTSLVIAFVMSKTLHAQEYYSWERLNGYVNSEQTTAFNPGDMLTGISEVSVFPPETIGGTFYYYVRARIVDASSQPVTDWDSAGAWIEGGQQAPLAPSPSHFSVPVPNFSSGYTYEVQFRYILTIPGGPPGEHYLIDSNSFGWTN